MASCARVVGSTGSGGSVTPTMLRFWSHESTYKVVIAGVEIGSINSTMYDDGRTHLSVVASCACAAETRVAPRSVNSFARAQDWLVDHAEKCTTFAPWRASRETQPCGVGFKGELSQVVDP